MDSQELQGREQSLQSVMVQLSLDYPNTWCPHLIRMAEIFGYRSDSSIATPINNYACKSNNGSFHLQWTEQGRSYTVRLS